MDQSVGPELVLPARDSALVPLVDTNAGSRDP